jgi:hypothetical protein
MVASRARKGKEQMKVRMTHEEDVLQVMVFDDKTESFSSFSIAKLKRLSNKDLNDFLSSMEDTINSCLTNVKIQSLMKKGEK